MSSNFLTKLWYKIFNKGKYIELKNEKIPTFINIFIISLNGGILNKFRKKVEFNLDSLNFP